MNYEKVKKNVYYDPPDEYPHSSRNHAEDLADFIVPMGQMHNETIHDRGIAAGLEVSGAANAVEVTINPGVAVDGAGQMIVLATNGHGDIGSNPPLGSNSEVAVPVHLPLGGQANKTVYVTIQFSEILRYNEGSGGRREQVPWLRLQPVAGAGAYVDDGASVILAIATIAANGTLASLVASDGAVTYRRRSLGQAVEELRVRRAVKAGNQLRETVAARLNSAAGGGLQIGVANSGDGILFAKDDGTQCARVETRAGVVVFKDAAGREVVHIDANNSWMRIGAQGNEGDLVILDQRGNTGFAFDGDQCRLDIGGPQNGGHLYMRDAAAALRVHLDGNASAVNANNLNPYGQTAIDVNARFFRIHAWDLVLDGRSGGNKRALVDAGQKLVLNYANDYPNGVQLGGVLTDRDGVPLMGNPARKVLFQFLLTDQTSAWVTADISLPGGPRQFFAYTAVVMVNSLSDFDYDNLVFSDIIAIDGNPTGGWVSGNGSSFGGAGDARNMHQPFASGVAQTLTFRFASLGPDIQGAAIAVVFYE